jgi:hypothetical protein
MLKLIPIELPPSDHISLFVAFYGNSEFETGPRRGEVFGVILAVPRLAPGAAFSPSLLLSSRFANARMNRLLS